jgi:hypothetical protein
MCPVIGNSYNVKPRSDCTVPAAPTPSRMNESRRGAFWKPCAPPPFEHKKKGYQKRVKGGLGTMVRTSHAIVGQAQFKQRQEKRGTRQRHSLLDRNPRSIEQDRMNMSMPMVLEEVGVGGKRGYRPARPFTHPSEGSTKSARPVTITTGTPRFNTRGRTSHDGGGLASTPSTKTVGPHSLHCTFSGAWIAALTSWRLKYTGSTCIWANVPLLRARYQTEEIVHVDP